MAICANDVTFFNLVKKDLHAWHAAYSAAYSVEFCASLFNVVKIHDVVGITDATIFTRRRFFEFGNIAPHTRIALSSVGTRTVLVFFPVESGVRSSLVKIFEGQISAFRFKNRFVNRLYSVPKHLDFLVVVSEEVLGVVVGYLCQAKFYIALRDRLDVGQELLRPY